ncbi:sterol regulatory element-binding protein cleavage-activating protein-like [Dreissena polymorpha]|nr:sterol regulatory element-binding protein cleavage-activating protein-like [Dreissena polymorpha]XP_052246748.1 sterol regulatory element-binding protein cleavage-activating protein-like [Dreissena polymorpha]XP_052246749.1 sterol regulatory element-binding protein cleavage-activating protein-like [Dreissena polymorpha]
MQAIRERVSQVYYTHGLFCASHPISILVTVCGIILFMCYPLLYVPLPGNIPVEYNSPVKGFHPPPESIQRRDKSFADKDVTSIPRWYRGPAVAYIQQIVVKATVSPWEPTEHDPLDALIAPLGRLFHLLDEVERFRQQHWDDAAADRSLVDCCLRVSEPVWGRHTEKLLPEYGCLLLSPANLWLKNRDRFIADKEVLKTIYKRYNQALDAPPGLRDILFGLPWKQTGVSRYFIRNRQRTISYAITLVLKSYEERFVSGLLRHLESLYPETAGNANNSEVDHIVHLHYKNVNIYFEYTHLIVLYLVVLLYIYFSVKKIEMVKSKWGLALSAVVTVVSSLFMSVSICSIMGLNTQLNGGEVFPYLVVLIGMENVLVMTKSVVSTSIELDVADRVATGLSKEGWSITKNLLIELAIIAVGFFTFVPAIQEFCLFALVGLLTDFFLQMVFFVTVLSVDIRRMELSDLHKHKKDDNTSVAERVKFEPLFHCPFKPHRPANKTRFQHHFNLSSGVSMLATKGPTAAPRVQHESRLFQTEAIFNLPRRLRVVYFWASTRVVQRFIMVCTVMWILLILYKSGLVHHLTNTSLPGNGTEVPPSPDALEQIIKQQEQTNTGEQTRLDVLSPLTFWRGEVEDSGSVKHTNLETWRALSHTHWTTMFSYYNISIIGKYISILPSLHLSAVISPEEAIQLRVPGYQSTWSHKKPKEQSINPKIPEIQQQEIYMNGHDVSKNKNSKNDQNEGSVTTETVDKNEQRISAKESKEPEFMSEEFFRRYYPYMDPEQLKHLYYPKSRLEFIVTVSLGFLSVICMTYFIMVLYRCMCSRKYSKWRASWNKVPKNTKGNSYFKQMKQAVPIILKGHLQEIECLTCDGSVIISSCLGGQLKVWDSITGECLHTMQRKSATPPMRRKPCEGRNVEDSDAELYAEYHGNHGNPKVSSRDLDLSALQDDVAERPQMRHRRKHEPKERTPHAELNREKFEHFPDLRSTIDTNFSAMFSMPRQQIDRKGEGEKDESSSSFSQSDISEHFSNISDKSVNSSGFNFEDSFKETYEEHKKYYMESQQDEDARIFERRANRSKSWSEGDPMGDSSITELPPAPIWSLTCRGNLVVVGCGNGKIEFWDPTNGSLKCVYSNKSQGVTGVNLVGHRVIAARLDGTVDFLELETFQTTKSSTPLSPSSLNRKIKGHSRHMSHGRCGSDDLRLWDEGIHCTLVQTTQAHQRPITVLVTEGGRIVSGSQDFTLKVFRLEDYKCLYTLHGHAGAISCLYLDKCTPYAAVSGAADGTIRLWDLLTGHCVHKVKGHEATVMGLTCTDTYIISSGLDDKLCVWERKRGHLLYSVEMETSCGTSMAILCNNFVVTGGQGCLYLWDLHKGELVRTVSLRQGSSAPFLHHVHSLESSTIVCDYGNEVKVIHFPMVLEKKE